jgi:predicted TIM-barrel fold metal-dependent hydrolase
VTTVDLHQHLWPQRFIHLLGAREEPPCHRDGTLVTVEGSFPLDLGRHDPERRLAELDRDRVDVAVLSLQASLGLELLPSAERAALEEAWTEGADELVAASGGRFRALAPWRIVPGFAGISVGTSALLVAGGSPVLAEAEAAGVPVLVHPEAELAPAATRPAWWPWVAGYTGQVQRAFLAWLADGRTRHPALRIVFAGLAGGALAHAGRLAQAGVDLGAPDPDTLFETSTCDAAAVGLALAIVGADRVAYGSDTPVVDPRATLAAVHALDERARWHVLGGTAARLLGDGATSSGAA